MPAIVFGGKYARTYVSKFDSNLIQILLAVAGGIVAGCFHHTFLIN